MPTLKEISDSLSMPLDGDGSIMVKGPSEPKTASKNQLAIAMNENFVRDLAEGDAQTAIVVEGTDWRRLGLKGVLYVKKSRYVLAKINAFFEDKEVEWEGVHETSLISKETSFSENVSIGPFCIIGSYVSIGENSSIGSGVFIGQGAVIGKGAVIHSGVRIGRNVIIGDDFICQPNAVIGSDGFSFVSPDGGGIEQARKERSAIEIPQINKYVRISSLGSVIIGDDVEIGAGSVIDRGTIENTTIGNGTKLDNLVHVAHNVSIGENCLLCGQVGIAGSSKIGNRVVLGGQVGVADHISIGNDSIIAGKSGVSSNVPDGRFMMGNPAIKIENNIGSYKAFRRLPKILKKIENLERILLKKK